MTGISGTALGLSTWRRAADSRGFWIAPTSTWFSSETQSRWQTSEPPIFDGGSPPSVRWAPTVAARRARSVDAYRATQLSALTDFELVVRWRHSDAALGDAGGVVLRGSGAATTETGYTVLPYIISGGSNAQIRKYAGGNFTNLASATFSLAAGADYLSRIRIVGTTIRMKTWPASGLEPGSWLLSATDSAIASGWFGLHSFNNGGSKNYYGIGVSLDPSSHPAPTGP